LNGYLAVVKIKNGLALSKKSFRISLTLIIGSAILDPVDAESRNMD
jgi:hypothetical protein